ncbi:MAG: gliding motility-associated peptidyl-prolyl isomerase GldI [Flavobacterium sp.]
MNIIKKITVLAIGSIAIASCSQQQARRPISQTSGEFMKQSVIRNKKLIKGEEAQIDSIIKNNPNIQYIASQKGYWYTYEVKNEKDTLLPKKGDIAYFDYELKDLNGNVIYSDVELRPQIYRVDKQNIMMGLRDGIKLMRKNEKVTFLFPSHMGYGYHGDNKKIGPNVPLICTVTLNDFKKEASAKPNSKTKTE